MILPGHGDAESPLRQGWPEALLLAAVRSSLPGDTKAALSGSEEPAPSRAKGWQSWQGGLPEASPALRANPVEAPPGETAFCDSQ